MDFVYVDDVVNALELAMNSKKNGYTMLALENHTH